MKLAMPRASGPFGGMLQHTIQCQPLARLHSQHPGNVDNHPGIPGSQQLDLPGLLVAFQQLICDHSQYPYVNGQRPAVLRLEIPVDDAAGMYPLERLHQTLDGLGGLLLTQRPSLDQSMAQTRAAQLHHHGPVASPATPLPHEARQRDQPWSLDMS
ncbi:hypothetical protein SELMODRAFT_418654 [Selaginella moellendorffii]|uniref:Uncharacterized protein n=1 Tax=Selaginella moellendorffii TaxID=88036 RepID=D8S6Q6_SELML|nr:hypothetical protein SELMODRAFT_418654 [Selaginella moellendorffii]